MQNHSKAERTTFIQGALRVKQDCFAYDKFGKQCKALDKLYCLTGKCNFYKTEAEMCAACKKSKKTIPCDRCKAIRYVP